ncbi:MAG: hypothetical protein ACRDVP_04340, partial [Acidimicrobiales bacterium]
MPPDDQVAPRNAGAQQGACDAPPSGPRHAAHKRRPPAAGRGRRRLLKRILIVGGLVVLALVG